MPLLLALLAALLFGTIASSQAPSPTLDYGFYKAKVEPLFLEKRVGHARCVTCHEGSATLRLQRFTGDAETWTEAQSRQNFEAISKLVVPGSPNTSKLLRHPLSREAGGDVFHGGGKHWTAKTDAEWQVLAAWVNGATLATAHPGNTKITRIVQTNAAGDNVDLIDPATNKIVGVINNIEVPHGVTSAPDGTKLYFTNESLSTVDVVDGQTLAIVNRIPLTGHPNNITISNDGKRVYAGIAQQPGAVDVIDTDTMTRVKSIPVRGAVHNVYVTPDGKWVVSGSVASKVLTAIDQKTETVAWELEMSSGIRPVAFETNKDGSTSRAFVELSDYHGIAVVDWATHKESTRFETPAIPGEEKHTDGLQGAPMHGFAVALDGKMLLATSKMYSTMYAYSLPELKLLGTVHVGQHPEWITLTPDGKRAYVAAAGDNSVTAVDLPSLKVVANIPVGQVPKRNGTAVLLK